MLRYLKWQFRTGWVSENSSFSKTPSSRVSIRCLQMKWDGVSGSWRSLEKGMHERRVQDCFNLHQLCRKLIEIQSCSSHHLPQAPFSGRNEVFKNSSYQEAPFHIRDPSHSFSVRHCCTCPCLTMARRSLAAPLNIRPLSDTIKAGDFSSWQISLQTSKECSSHHVWHKVKVHCMDDATGKQAQPYFVGSHSTRVPDV